MPGIVGLLTKMPRELAEYQLRRMVNSLCHESFYQTGFIVDEALGIYVGWCDREGSISDEMPLRSENGEVVLVFSGEEFSEPTTPLRLKAQGCGPKIDKSEYLVHLYEDDPGFPTSLNGRFHGLLIDKARDRAILFNDRYGMHRIYYHESEDAFYFAAEAKAILSVLPGLKTIDLRGLGELVSCGCVLENRTIFNKIQVLPCASRWTFQNAAIARRETYFMPQEWEQQAPLEPEDFYRELRDVFPRILSRYFKGPQPIGMSLTGGLDTRMIMAWQKPASGSLPCYTFGGPIRECQDVVVARRVARFCQQPHSVIPVDAGFLTRFPEYAERAVFLTDGCVEVNRAADLYLNQIARSIAPVRMTGNYGGEVMRRVRAFKPMPTLPSIYSREFFSHISQAEATYSSILPGHPLSFAVFRQAPWHHYGLHALEQTQLTLRSPYLDNDFVRTIYRAPESACANSDVCLRLIAEGDKALSFRTDRGLGGTGLVASAIHAALEFQFKAEYAFDYGMPQWLAPIDNLLSGLQPEKLFLGRHKFAHYRVWYRDILGDYVRGILLNPVALSRPHLESRNVEEVVNGHLSGRANRTLELHKLLTVELIYRSLLAPVRAE